MNYTPGYCPIYRAHMIFPDVWATKWNHAKSISDSIQTVGVLVKDIRRTCHHTVWPWLIST